jgi:hypothetical protein
VTEGAPRSGSVTPGATAEFTIGTTIDAYGRLTVLAARASYASDSCTAAEAADAELLGDLVRAGLTRPTGRRRVSLGS